MAVVKAVERRGLPGSWWSTLNEDQAVAVVKDSQSASEPEGGPPLNEDHAVAVVKAAPSSSQRWMASSLNEDHGRGRGEWCSALPRSPPRCWTLNEDHGRGRGEGRTKYSSPAGVMDAQRGPRPWPW